MLLRSQRLIAEPAIDLTPIIDMVFMLLTFFLVASTYYQAEREIKVALPFATSAAPISQLLRELVVNVDAQGRMFVGSRAVDATALASIVADAVKQNPDQKVTVRGDRAAAYASVVGVLDICKSNGVQEPYLDTVLAK